MEGDNIIIKIGDKTRFTHTVHFCAQEYGSKIEVGEDCGFSNRIIVRTSDSHEIIDIHTGERINPAKPVLIGSHVWICPGTTIMKGTVIGDYAIIGSNSLVTKEVPPYCLAAGMPAKVLRTGVMRTKKEVVFCNNNDKDKWY